MNSVPSKSLIAAAKAAHTVRTVNSKFKGISSDNLQINMKDIKQGIQDKIQHIHDEDDSPEAMAKLGIDTIMGQKATFVNENTVVLSSADSSSSTSNPSTTTVRANMGIIIATGASPVEPSDDMIEGLSKVPFLTYEQIFDLDEIPRRLTVIGGGPIGCELAQAFGRLGSTVTQVSDK